MSIKVNDWWIAKVSIVITLLANILLAIISPGLYERRWTDNLMLFIAFHLAILIVVCIIYYFKSRTTLEINAKETVQKHKKALEKWESFQPKYKKLIDSDIYNKVEKFIKNLEDKSSQLSPEEDIPDFNEKLEKFNDFYDDSMKRFSKFLRQNNFEFTEYELAKIKSIETDKYYAKQFNKDMLKAKSKNLEGFIRRFMSIKGDDYTYYLVEFENFLKTQNILLSCEELEIKIKEFIEQRNQKKFEKDFLD